MDPVELPPPFTMACSALQGFLWARSGYLLNYTVLQHKCAASCQCLLAQVQATATRFLPSLPHDNLIPSLLVHPGA